MTTYTITLPLTKNENNDFIDANSVAIEVNEKNVKNIASVLKNMPDTANQTRISLDGPVSWLKDGTETNDQIRLEELIVFKGGDLFVVGTEKDNLVEIESCDFKIDEVEDVLLSKKNASVHMVLVAVKDADRNDVEGFEDVLFYDAPNFLETSKLEAQVVSISDFLDMLNNQEIKINDFWITQIRLEK